MAKQNQTNEGDGKQVFSIRLLREMALGNGTRPQGFILGMVDVVDGQMRLDTAKTVDGVTEAEMTNALLNPQLLELV